MTQCNKTNSSLKYISLSLDKDISLEFDGGNVTSDGGVLFLAEVDKRIGLTEKIAQCIIDQRHQGKIIHTVREMLRQRVYQIGCGYEDCNDAQTLRKDPAMKISVGKRPEKDGDLCSQPTLSRFENNVTRKELLSIGKELIEHFVDTHKYKEVTRIVVDIDTTEDSTHGHQQLTFFQGYYDCYCYLPLLVFATVNDEKEQHLIASVLRPSDIHAGKKTLGVFSRVILPLKKAFPHAEIILRADSGFALPEIYDWCEENNIIYVIGLPKNDRLMARAIPYRASTSLISQITGHKAKLYGEFRYAAKTWTKLRRVVVKSEHLHKGENVRFVVTNWKKHSSSELYWFYTQRGDVENRIEEFKNHIKADRTSCSSFLANQFRLYLHAIAFILFQNIRLVLKGTQLERAEIHTIRVKLLKIGARIKESVRRIWIHCASGFPLQQIFRDALQKLSIIFPQVRGSL